MKTFDQLKRQHGFIVRCVLIVILVRRSVAKFTARDESILEQFGMMEDPLITAMYAYSDDAPKPTTRHVDDMAFDERLDEHEA